MTTAEPIDVSVFEQLAAAERPNLLAALGITITDVDWSAR